MARKVNEKSVRVRIAPSPTGFAHLGTAWMALFNFAFAKKNNGKLILRLEDTDVERNIDEAEHAIYEGLHWLGIDWDEGPDKGGDYGPYKQSERIDLYQKKANVLLKKGLVKKDGNALRFNNPDEDVSWQDEVRGKITFPGNQIQDFVILRSNGIPTYNFAAVVDDIEMKISHVIRGEEHISNTPKQIALYKALGEDLPKFAHLPTLRNDQRKKLSKRRDKVDLGFYQKQGYLPNALVNFLCLLGWSHPKEKEIFDLNEFISLFDLKRVQKAGPIFNVQKLDWMNGEYIRNLKSDEFNEKLREINGNWKKADAKILKKIGSLVQERINKLSEVKDLAGFFFERKRSDEKLFGKNFKNHLKNAYTKLENVEKWDLGNINKTLNSLIEKENFHTGKFYMDLRVAIAASKVTPPINESIEILGKKETLERIKAVL